MKRNETSLLRALLAKSRDMDTVEHSLLALSIGLAILATLHVLSQGAGQIIPTR
jgi:Flp pilus assembly pilin Flp